AGQRCRGGAGYAACLGGPGGRAGVHVACAASPVVAQVLGQVAQAVGQGRVVPVDDVVPADPGDPRSTGLAAAVLPLILTSLIAGVLLALMVRGRWARGLGILAYAALAGLAVTAILQYGLDALPGAYLANSAVVALLAL